MRNPIILAVVALVLSGCNANQEVKPERAHEVVSGPNFPDYNPYNPVTYAQTSGLYGGGQNYHGPGR